jgi:hypothetical protein
MSSYVYEPFENASGVPMWACHKPGGGICGYGYTMADALNDYLDKTESLVPDPESAKVERAIDDELHREAFGE